MTHSLTVSGRSAMPVRHPDPRQGGIPVDTSPASESGLRPPQGGDEPPRMSGPLGDGPPVDLEALAGQICRQYREEFPDEQARYGEAGNSWCVHDNQHLLNWAVESVNGEFDIREQVAWLANVLQARDFPVDRLARTLDIGADVVAEHLTGAAAGQLVDVLTDTAVFVRSGAFADYEPDDE